MEAFVSQDSHLLLKTIEQYCREFPDYKETLEQKDRRFEAPSRTGTIQLEIKEEYFSLSLIYVGWMMSLISAEKKDELATHTLFSISYGPGTDNRFHYPRFFQFCMVYWPKLLTLLADDKGSVPLFGIRELTLVPEDQRWDPNSPFVLDCLTGLMQAVKSYVYK